MGRDHESRFDGEKGRKDPLQVLDMVLAALESWPRAWHGMILAATAPLPTIFHVFQRGAAPGVWGWVTMKRPQEETLPGPMGFWSLPQALPSLSVEDIFTVGLNKRGFLNPNPAILFLKYLESAHYSPSFTSANIAISGLGHCLFSPNTLLASTPASLQNILHLAQRDYLNNQSDHLTPLFKPLQDTQDVIQSRLWDCKFLHDPGLRC